MTIFQTQSHKRILNVLIIVTSWILLFALILTGRVALTDPLFMLLFLAVIIASCLPMNIGTSKIDENYASELLAMMIFTPFAYFIFMVYGKSSVSNFVVSIAFLIFIWFFVRKSMELSALSKQLQHKISRVMMQRDIAKIASSSLNMEKMLNSIVDNIGKVNGIGFIAVNLENNGNLSHTPSAQYVINEDGWDMFFENRIFLRLRKHAYKTAKEMVITETENIRRITGTTNDELSKIKLIAIYPIIVSNRPVGTITIAASDPELLKDSQYDCIEFIANELASSIMNAHLHDDLQKEYDERSEELKYAAQVQQVILPKQFMTERVRIETVFKSARIIGGDFFEIYPRPDGSVAIAIGDVSGKGVPAALTMMRVISILKQLARVAVRSSDILFGLNDEMDWENAENDNVTQYATCFVAIFNPKTGLLRYSNAGHVNPFVYIKKDDNVHQLISNGFPLGMFSASNYNEETIKLAPGDKLVMYTDGATDTVDTSGERYNIKRLHYLVLDKCRSEGNTARAIHEGIMSYRKSVQLTDDIAIVTLEYLEGLEEDELEDEAVAYIDSSIEKQLDY